VRGHPTFNWDDYPALRACSGGWHNVYLASADDGLLYILDSPTSTHIWVLAGPFRSFARAKTAYEKIARGELAATREKHHKRLRAYADGKHEGAEVLPSAFEWLRLQCLDDDRFDDLREQGRDFATTHTAAEAEEFVKGLLEE
jgi:hypothetical protein